MTDAILSDLLHRIERIAHTLERMAPAELSPPDFEQSEAYSWVAEGLYFKPVPVISRIDFDLLKGIDRVRDLLMENTARFAKGLPANNVLLWGARGMGKSSLVKAAHERASKTSGKQLKLIEIHREDIESLPQLMSVLRNADYRFILFCDDLSFDAGETSYKSLKAVLEGGIEGRPENVVFYATSNRRHLLPRDMMENERATAINPGDAIEEKVSLSDRFGLWLGFHKCTQDDFLDMVAAYIDHFELDVATEVWKPKALEWSTTRGARSGRVAWQFIQDLAGEMGKSLQ